MNNTKNIPCKVFISHAAKDEPIINELVDLLQTGLNLQHDDIFCTCVKGLGIKGGYNFVDVIKSKIIDSTLVIAFLSKNYFASQFCMSELGATWITSKEFKPLLDSSLSYADAKGVLVGVHIHKINDADDMTQFAEEALEVLGTKTSLTRMVTKIRQFIKEYPELQLKVDQPFSVTEREWESKNDELEALTEEVNEQKGKIKSLESLVEDLKVCKDSADVSNVILSHKDTSEIDRFTELVYEVKYANEFFREVAKFIAYDKLGLQAPNDTPYSKDEYDDALSKKYLEQGDDGLCVNENNRKVKRFFEAIDSLEEFMANASRELKVEIEEKYDVDFELDNGDFLKKVIDIG
jgi:hypothetical protein